MSRHRQLRPREEKPGVKNGLSMWHATSDAVCRIETWAEKKNENSQRGSPICAPAGAHQAGEQQPIRQRATDQEIQKWISRQHGFVPESAWLLHCKELFGLAAPGTAQIENPCPPEKVAAIQQAFRRFGLI